MIGTKKTMNRVVSCLATFAVLLGLSACGPSSQGDDGQGRSDVSTNVSSRKAELSRSQVVFFVPADGITISQHTPLNKWAEFTPILSDGLRKTGIPAKSITTKTSGDFAQQSRDVQDFVDSHLSNGNKEHGRHTTIILAPAVSSDDNQYGDYVTRPQHIEDGVDHNVVTGPTSEDSEAHQRFVSALKSARKAGAHVVLISQSISGFVPDLYVQMSTPRAIGELQARQLVEKLAIDKATANHPKAIEVMLPSKETSDSLLGSIAGKTDSAQQKERQDNKEEASVTVSDDFAQEAFAGVWSVLGQYFKDGRVFSPSSRLDAQSTQDDWRNVAFPAQKSSQVSDELEKRLSVSDKDDKTSQPAHIDGIVAMNDFVSDAVIDKLTDLKYQGSSADINPDISISGILGTITGQHNLYRQTVPKPNMGLTSKTQTPQNPNDSTTNPTSPELDDNQKTGGLATHDPSQSVQPDMSWPIVTGFGVYTHMIPRIVDGKQWMTGMEDLHGVADTIANANVSLVTGTNVSTMPEVSNKEVNGVKTPVITAKLIAVSAGNLKKEMIDPGYVSMADAGL